MSATWKHLASLATILIETSVIVLLIATSAWADERMCMAGPALGSGLGTAPGHNNVRMCVGGPALGSGLGMCMSGPALGSRLGTGPGHNNVAALYCLTLGYETDVLRDKRGEQGICVFPDGTSCLEWDFYAGTCGADQSLCAMLGAEQRNKTDGHDTYAPNYTACVIDGVEVNVSDLLGFPHRFNTPINPIVNPPGIVGRPVPLAPVPLAPMPLPGAFSWRNEDGQDWMTSVKDQSQCGSCWAFSAVGTVEGAFNVQRNNSSFDLDLSEELLNGGSAGSCCGGSHFNALGIIKSPGIPDEACLPYDVSYYTTGGCDCFGNPPCNATCTGLPTECSHLLPGDACADEASRHTTITDFHGVGPNIDDIKEKLIDEGPISVCYAHQGTFNNDVYECPFGWCRTTNDDPDPGIPCNSSGDPVCPSGTTCEAITTNHCVVIAGYDDATQSWLLKNSWGMGYNGDGYFNMRYGNCHIEDSAFWVEAGDTPNRAPTADADGPYSAECGGATTTLPVDGTGSSDPDGDSLGYAWTSTCPGASFNDATAATPNLSVSTSSLTSALNCQVDLTVEDPGTLSSSDSAAVTISDTLPPSITCPADQMAECTGPAGATVSFPDPTASDICTTTPTTDCDPPSGSTFPVGTTVDTCSATDASNNSGDCTFEVSVVDTTPPVITSATPSVSVLWPPNHKMVPISVAVEATDVCSATTCDIASIASNEPVNGQGDGNTTPDWTIDGPLAASLRAERSGGGGGRTYTLTIECSDASGNSATTAVHVTVPANQGKK